MFDVIIFIGNRYIKNNAKSVLVNLSLDFGRLSHYCYNSDAMPAIEVQLFKDSRGVVPVQKWLDDLEAREPDAYAACVDAILQLSLKGHELRRPACDFLRNGIYELRIKKRKVHYRILYFFHDKNAVLSDGIRGKKGKVDCDRIDKAIRCRELVESSPEKYIATLQTKE